MRTKRPIVEGLKVEDTVVGDEATLPFYTYVTKVLECCSVLTNGFCRLGCKPSTSFQTIMLALTE